MEVPWNERKPPSFGLLIIAAGCAVATLLAMVTVDVPMARLSAESQAVFWEPALATLDWVLLMPIDMLVAPIVLVVAMLVVVIVKRWRHLAPPMMTIVAVHLLARLSTNWLKDATDRYRPRQWTAKGVEGSFGYDGGVSFPSGHVTLYASLIIPILYAFPRTRRFALPLLAIVAFVMVQRFSVHDHWVSDTLGSLTLVALLTWAVGWATRPERASPRASRE